MSTEEGAPSITSSIVRPSSSSSVSTCRIVMEGGGISPENVIHVINPSSLGSLSSVVNAVSSTAAGGMSGLHTITIAPGSFPIPVNFASNLQVMCRCVMNCHVSLLQGMWKFRAGSLLKWCFVLEKNGIGGGKEMKVTAFKCCGKCLDVSVWQKLNFTIFHQNNLCYIFPCIDSHLTIFSIFTMEIDQNIFQASTSTTSTNGSSGQQILMAPPELAAKLKEGALPTQVIQVPNANLASIDWAVKLKVSSSLKWAWEPVLLQSGSVLMEVVAKRNMVSFLDYSWGCLCRCVTWSGVVFFSLRVMWQTHICSSHECLKMIPYYSAY